MSLIRWLVATRSWNWGLWGVRLRGTRILLHPPGGGHIQLREQADGFGGGDTSELSCGTVEAVRQADSAVQQPCEGALLHPSCRTETHVILQTHIKTARDASNVSVFTFKTFVSGLRTHWSTDNLVDVGAEMMTILPHSHFHQAGTCGATTPRVHEEKGNRANVTEGDGLRERRAAPSTKLTLSTVTCPPSEGKRYCVQPDTWISIPPVL